MLVRDYMTRNVITLSPDMEILKALLVLAENDISGAPVLDGRGPVRGSVIGMLTEKDCLKSALEAAYHSEFGGLVSDYMSREVASVEPDDGVVKVAERFVTHPYHRYPVLEDGALVGIISRRDVIQALAGAWQWK
jgi:CBS domain-containing protein